MRFLSAVGIGCLGAAAAGCASRPAPASAIDPEPAVSPPRAAVPAGTGRFTWASAVRRLEVRTDAEVVRDGSADAPERVSVATYLTDTLAAGVATGAPPGAATGAVRAAGTVDSVRIAVSERVRGAAPPVSVDGLRYLAASDARGVRVDPAPGAAVDLRCTAPEGAAALGAFAAVREALPRVPADAAPGARWRDVSVSASCAGPVLLVVQTTSRYEAAAGPGGALAVVRRSTSTMRGQGAAGVRPLVVAGGGSGETRYLLDPARGALASGSGEGSATLTVTVAGAAQRFVQRTRTEIVVR